VYAEIRMEEGKELASGGWSLVGEEVYLQLARKIWF